MKTLSGMLFLSAAKVIRWPVARAGLPKPFMDRFRRRSGKRLGKSSPPSFGKSQKLPAQNIRPRRVQYCPNSPIFWCRNRAGVKKAGAIYQSKVSSTKPWRPTEHFQRSICGNSQFPHSVGVEDRGIRSDRLLLPRMIPSLYPEHGRFYS